MSTRPLGWAGIARLGLVQAALGSIVVLATSTMNRVMVVELALPAIVPGALVALQYAVQVLRPRLGHGSDVGGRRTPWIIGGMATLALGGVGAAAATGLMATHRVAGLLAAVLAYLLIGVGVGASGTSLLVLLAKRVEARRRAAAATIVWLMMMVGFVITATLAGRMLDPFSPARLLAVMAVVCAACLALTCAAVWGVEGTVTEAAADATLPRAPKNSFAAALREVWGEAQARRFAIFVFVSMLAYSGQELVLEPFAGAVFHLTPGESTRLAGTLHGGVLIGMLIVAIAGTAIGGRRLGTMRTWTLAGCLGSAIAILLLACGGLVGGAGPLRPAVFVLGMANGAFAVSAIGAMMGLAGADAGNGSKAGREGVRMGLWGAAQAIAFAAGGLVATTASDLARAVLGSPQAAYAAVFIGEAVLFLIAARLAQGVFAPRRIGAMPVHTSINGGLLAVETSRG
jgi:BCD family chlorophyll transporter-like MFS transporter